jgi:DNA-binding PadR family transcriptional regulator
MTNADEDALRAARPNVGMWLDKLRRAGHVVFVRQFQQGAKPNAGYRISVDGQTMTAWELWARFRSELGDEESTLPSVERKKALTVNSPKSVGG